MCIKKNPNKSIYRNRKRTSDPPGFGVGRIEMIINAHKGSLLSDENISKLDCVPKFHKSTTKKLIILNT